MRVARPGCWAYGCTTGKHSEDCLRARREHARVKIALRAQLLAVDPTLRSHGDADTYEKWGCRCIPCRDAAREKRYRYAMKGSNVLSERAVGRDRYGTTPPFGREWLDAGTN